MKWVFRIINTFILLVLLIIPATIFAENGIIIELEDTANDDYGPGNYQYPNNEVFEEKGLFDITSFSITDKDQEYLFEVGFNNLTDPWNSKYGFSHPLIEIYIDNVEGGSKELLKKGANVKLDDNYPWDILLKISGWWVRLYHPGDLDSNDSNFWKVEKNPFDIENVEMRINDNKINMLIDKTLIGDLIEARFFLLVGGFDPFGPDHFRIVKNEPSDWYFLNSDSQKDNFTTNVIDIITTTTEEQNRILTARNNNYPVLKPIFIGKSENKKIYINILIIILLLLLLALFIMNKNQFLSNNK